MADAASGRAKVGPERRMTIRPRRHEVVLSAADDAGAEAGDDVPAVGRRRELPFSFQESTSDCLRPPSSIPGQEIEHARPVEQLANARRGVRDPELTVLGRGQVEEIHQRADATGVQIRYGREIQHDSPNAAAQDGMHGPLQFEVERDAQGSADVQDRDAGRTFLSN